MENNILTKISKITRANPQKTPTYASKVHVGEPNGKRALRGRASLPQLTTNRLFQKITLPYTEINVQLFALLENMPRYQFPDVFGWGASAAGWAQA